MELEKMIEMISTVGFSVIACIGLAYYITKLIKAIMEDSAKDKERLYEEIRFNRETNQALLESNKMLIQDINIKLEKIEKSLEK